MHVALSGNLNYKVVSISNYQQLKPVSYKQENSGQILLKETADCPQSSEIGQHSIPLLV